MSRLNLLLSLVLPISKYQGWVCGEVGMPSFLNDSLFQGWTHCDAALLNIPSLAQHIPALPGILGRMAVLILPWLKWGQTSARPVLVGQSCCGLSPSLQKPARMWILGRSFLLLLLERMSISWGFQSCALLQSFQTWPFLGLFPWVRFGSRIPRDGSGLAPANKRIFLQRQRTPRSELPKACVMGYNKKAMFG